MIINCNIKAQTVLFFLQETNLENIYKLIVNSQTSGVCVFNVKASDKQMGNRVEGRKLKTGENGRKRTVRTILILL